jgi:glutathione S-transferase
MTLDAYSGDLTSTLGDTRTLAIGNMSSKSATGYHLQCSGEAAKTAEAHQDENATIHAYFACFCPFVQRAWIALELLGAGTYKKPKELLEISPKGLVP